jgi:hypothetical protein
LTARPLGAIIDHGARPVEGARFASRRKPRAVDGSGAMEGPMKLVLWLFFLVSPVPGIIAYLASDALVLGDSAYLAAQIAGISAFCWFSGQFLLASKPFGMVSALGAVGHQRLHVALAALGILASHAHWAIKAFAFGAEYEPYVIAGHAAMSLLSVASLAAWLLISPLGIARKKPVVALRAALSKSGLTWPRVRAVHSCVALAALALVFHVFSAWSTTMSWLPASWMATWFGASFASFLVYRIRGRESVGGR